MRTWRERAVIAAVLCALAGLLALTMRRTTLRTARVTLPDTSGLVTVPDDDMGAGLALLDIRPRTVQAAAATLEKPDSWRRTVAITQYWDGGSGTSTADVIVYLPWARVDLTVPGGETRHTLTNGEETYIWYGEETEVFHAPAGGIGIDGEQRIPTWEDIFTLSPDYILAADYRTVGEENCLYADTIDADGYETRYSISVETGLLSAAERLRAGELVYRMEASPAEPWEPDPAPFTLPDGRMVTPVP